MEGKSRKNFKMNKHPLNELNKNKPYDKEDRSMEKARLKASCDDLLKSLESSDELYQDIYTKQVIHYIGRNLLETRKKIEALTYLVALLVLMVGYLLFL